MSLIQITSLFLPTGDFSGGIGATRGDLIEQIRRRLLKVLLVDDNREFRESLVYLLNEIFDAETFEVKSGPEAVELIKTGLACNIIFLDLVMPDQDGLITYDEMRKAGALCPIILMSAHPDSKTWKEAESRGLELIEKPIYPEVLTTILSEL